MTATPNRWLNDRHPHAERFQERRALIEVLLTSTESDADRDLRLRAQGVRVLLNFDETITRE